MMGRSAVDTSKLGRAPRLGLPASTVAVRLATCEPGANYGDERVRASPGQGGRPCVPVEMRGRPVDLGRAEQAVADLLDALGIDRSDEGVVATPARVARAYTDVLTPTPFEATTFPNDDGYEELVVATDVPFRSLCEHHLLPFSGVAHVGYLPGSRVVGLSKLARVVDHCASRLQVQERLTAQVADWLTAHVAPKGVGVVIDAEHACVSLRGVRAAGVRTVTSAMSGQVRDDHRTRAEFLALTRGPR